jgi:hypothetical protein
MLPAELYQPPQRWTAALLADDMRTFFRAAV